MHFFFIFLRILHSQLLFDWKMSIWATQRPKVASQWSPSALLLCHSQRCGWAHSHYRVAVTYLLSQLYSGVIFIIACTDPLFSISNTNTSSGARDYTTQGVSWWPWAGASPLFSFVLVVKPTTWWRYIDRTSISRDERCGHSSCLTGYHGDLSIICEWPIFSQLLHQQVST